MAKVTIQTLTVAIDHAPNSGPAGKQVCTQIAEAMGLSIVTVQTDSPSTYSAYYCYNNDHRFQIRLTGNSSGYISALLCRQDSSGQLSNIAEDRLIDISYSSSSTYYYSFRLVTAGTLKYIKYVSTDYRYCGFGVATMINVYDSKVYPIVFRSSSGSIAPTIYVYTMLDDYSLVTLNTYTMSDTTIPYDGKFYLVPFRFGSTTYNIMGSPGGVSYFFLYGTSMFGDTWKAESLPAGTLLSIGGISVVFMWQYIFIGLE